MSSETPSSRPVTRSVDLSESELDESVRSLRDNDSPAHDVDHNDISAKGVVSMKEDVKAQFIKRYSTKLFNVEQVTNDNKRRIGFLLN